MREAARALDDVSDHLGEVLRRADDLLVEWSRFGAQVREQVEREAAAIGGIVDGAVGRAAASGIDRGIGERLRALTGELERIEQRARAASRAVVEQRDADRRILWAVVAGIVLANALLVVLILRKPAAAPVAEPIRLDAVATPSQPAADPAQDPALPAGEAGSAAAGSGASPMGGSAEAVPGSPAVQSGGAATASGTSKPAGAVGGSAGGAKVAGGSRPGEGAAVGSGGGATSSGAAGPGAGASAGQSAPARSGAIGGQGAARPAELAPKASPAALPPRPGAPHPHKKQP